MGLYEDLKPITGPDGVTTETEELVCYAYDASGRSFLPSAVVFPQTHDQAARVLHFASKHRIPVIPRGSGSGMTGGGVPVQGGIVMVTSRMNRILEIDKDNFTARVEPGVILEKFHNAVEKQGLFYPPDPASSSVCTIGGNIGECAGGPRAVKYGVTRDYVLGLKALLASGETIQTGVCTAKGVAGYDLTRLIVGSEGTLAFVTQVTLRLLAKPEQVKTMAVFFKNADQAAKAVSGIMKQAIVPRCVEYLDHACLKLVQNSLDFDITPGARAMLILEVDGNGEAVDRQSRQIETFCRQSGALDMIHAKDSLQAQSLWKARKALSPLLYKIRGSKLNEDIVVPISKIPAMVRAAGEIQKQYDLPLVCFGHAGDGNLHCNVMYDPGDENQFKRANQAVDDLFGAALGLGGTITGEHGVGLTKKKYLPREIGSTELALMKEIKKVFDPHHILNPGKIFL